MSTKTRRESVWRLIADREWHTTMEICAVDVGGSEGCRRLREIRREIEKGKRPNFAGIEKRKSAQGTQYEYRLIPYYRKRTPMRTTG